MCEMGVSEEATWFTATSSPVTRLCATYVYLVGMKTSDKTAPRDVVQRDLFNELTEGMAALSEGRHGKRMSSGKSPHSVGKGFVRASIWTTVPPCLS